MEKTLLTVLVSASVSIIVAGFGFWQAKRSLNLQARRVHESVTEELIRQRILPYSSFLSELELSSKLHCEDKFEDTHLISLEKALQSAIYGLVGLLASHETRQLLVYARLGCSEYRNKKNSENGNKEYFVAFNNLTMRRWAVLIAMRSDLGIAQPAWDDVLRSVGAKPSNSDFKAPEKLVSDFAKKVGGINSAFIYPSSA